VYLGFDYLAGTPPPTYAIPQAQDSALWCALMEPRILIVDDEPSIRKVLAAHLARFGYATETAASGVEAIAQLNAGAYELVVSDIRMPQIDGLELLAWIREHRPGVPVILITAHGTVANAVEALKRGAYDYVTKPFDADELRQTIAKAVATRERNEHRLSEAAGRFEIIGRTSAMRRVYDLIEKVAPSPSTVLITGESGTGKQLVARALHQQSARRDGPFIEVNCGAIPEHLVESELFGHERGAFTGAVASKPGRFELANGGTLFLDEVGELGLDTQVKLLRALQERTIDRVGGVRPIHIDVRVIAATNVDLERARAQGLFRDDLFWRLNVIPIPIPPLRDRIDDVPLLVEHFLGTFNARLGKQVQRVSPPALAALLGHSWPGNIRELENLMERGVLLADGPELELDALPPFASAARHRDPTLDDLDLKEFVRMHTVKLERERIQQALEDESQNVTRAARKLGISRKSLQMKMKEYDLR